MLWSKVSNAFHNSIQMLIDMSPMSRFSVILSMSSKVANSVECFFYKTVLSIVIQRATCKICVHLIKNNPFKKFIY